MNPFRVLHVLGKMNRGGAETMVMNLYRNIDRSKVQFDFIVHSIEKGDYDDEIKELGGNIFYLPKFRFSTVLKYVNSWVEFFYKHPEYQIIHGHIRSTASIYLPLAQKYGLKTVIHSHSTSNGSGFPSLIKYFFQIPLRWDIVDYYFACSKDSGRWLYGNARLTKANFHIFKNTIETMKYIQCPKVRISKRREMQLEGKFVIGHVGRFHQSKNHDFIIDILSEIYKKNKQVLLLLIGTGDLENKIKQKVSALGFSDIVKFLGVRSDVPDLLRAMDVFLFPSLYEGLPITLVEAQAAGLKIFASDNITKEITLTDCVEFISLDQPASYWADLILHNSGNYERYNTYSEICQEGYDVRANVKWIENFYLNLLINN